MYPNKLTTSSMSSYSFSSLTFFHEISCSTCHKFVLNQQDYRSIQKQKYLKSKYLKMYNIHNRYSSPNSNFKLVQQISSIKSGLKLANITRQKYLTCHKP